MSGLSPEAQRILDAARDGDDPTRGDKERLRSAVLASVGAAAAIGTGGAASSAAAASAGAATAGTVAVSGAGAGVLVKVIGLAVAVGIAGGTVALEPWNAGTTTASEFEHAPILETDTHEDPIPAPHTPRPEPEPEPVPEITSPPAAAPVPEAPRRPRATAPPAPAPTSTLADELTLLRAAQGARRAGDPTRALAELDRHARLFPDGVLAAEAQAARVLTLCDLGRTDDARAQREAFLAAHAGSPLAARVQNACH